MGWILIAGSFFSTALVTYLVLFFISTDKDGDGVSLRKHSPFWRMKYAAYYLPAILIDLVNNTSATSYVTEFDSKDISAACEQYADRTMSLCKTFWTTFLLYLIVSPLVIIGIVLVLVIGGAISLGYYTLLGIGMVAYVIFTPPRYLFFVWPKALINKIKQRQAAKREKKRVLPPAQPEFSTSYLVPTRTETATGKAQVSTVTFLQLFYTERGVWFSPGKLGELHALARKYQKMLKKKPKPKKDVLASAKIKFMKILVQDLLQKYWEIEEDFGDYQFIWSAGGSRSGNKLLSQISNLCEVPLDDFISEINILYEETYDSAIDSESRELPSPSDFTDDDDDDYGTEAAEKYLSERCRNLNKKYEAIEKEDWVSIFDDYQDELLELFGTKILEHGIIQIEKQYAEDSKRAFLEKEEQAKALEGRRKEQELAARQREARRRHYLDLARMFFSKVCPIIRVKEK